MCATFDDMNPDTRTRWAYPDSGEWDPERNTDEFIARLPEYKQHGVLSVTLCFQYGAPGRYVKQQPWHSTAFDRPDSNLLQATRLRVSWGYYDNGPGTLGSLTPSNYHDGFQNPPINWAINTDLKRAFFGQVKEITGC